MKILKYILPVIFIALKTGAQEISVTSLRLKPPAQLNYTSVKDQYMSSTCWSFSSNSLLESELLKAGKGSNDLSEMFIARFSMLRKIKMHLKLKGKNFFTPGGQFHDAMWVMKNYGMMPEEIYSGKGRGEINYNHAEMDTVLNYLVAEYVADGIQELSTQQQHKIDSLLDYYYGPVPDTFTYKGKIYTPITYLKNYLGIRPDDYVEITSYSHHPYYQAFVLEDKYNWTGDKYYNVPLADFSAITDYALQKGYTVGWDGDADDIDFNYYTALAYFSKPIKATQQARQAAFESQETLLNHMMHMVGVAKDKNGQKWYYIKNSWGNTSNAYGGFLYMRDDYFKIRTVAIIVNKKAIPDLIRKKIGIR